jgi:glucose 1-dehydrogenase
MENKVAIVTGASRGIGRGVALKLAEQGYHLVITHLDEVSEAEEVAHEISTKYQRSCHIVQCDLTLSESAIKVVEDAVQIFGKIDVLVNNAGVTMFNEIKEMPIERIDYMMNLDFRAPMLLIKYIANHMIDNQITGSIVNIGSSRAERAYPQDSIYGGMKAALVRASQSIAIELAPHGIRVNTVSPGAIQVRDDLKGFYNKLGNRIPLGRVGTPEDIGRAVIWLCSEEASYITGVNMRVDGGLILPGMPEH